MDPMVKDRMAGMHDWLAKKAFDPVKQAYTLARRVVFHIASLVRRISATIISVNRHWYFLRVHDGGFVIYGVRGGEGRGRGVGSCSEDVMYSDLRDATLAVSHASRVHADPQPIVFRLLSSCFVCADVIASWM
jgi:hypothetical protein